MSEYHTSADQPGVFTFNHLTFDVELFLILFSGLILKILSMAFKKEEADPYSTIKLKEVYWANSGKYRTLGSLLVIFQIAFLSTDEMIKAWMTYEIGSYNFGYFTIAGMGYISDNIFIMLHHVGSSLMSKLETNIGKWLNGHDSNGDGPQNKRPETVGPRAPDRDRSITTEKSDESSNIEESNKSFNAYK